MHIWHPSGAFIEIHPDGKIVMRAKGKAGEHGRYVVIGSPRDASHDRLHVYGNWEVVTEGHATIHIKESMHLKVDKNLKIEVGEDFDMVVHHGHHHTKVEDKDVLLDAKKDIRNHSGTGIFEESKNNHHD